LLGDKVDGNAILHLHRHSSHRQNTFKCQVDRARPKVGENHHGAHARRFAQEIVDDAGVLEVIETHDAAYHAWLRGARHNDWEQARAQAEALLARLGAHLELYLAFFHCDNHTGDKRQDNYHWFCNLIAERQYE